MAEPTISVVIPVLNGARYVDQALGSVAMQRRPPDEVIVADDGSTDGSADLAERWAPLLPVRVLRIDHVGVWAARNAAIESADSDLIALLDIDDVWLPDHLAVLLAVYEKQPGLVTANAMMWVEGQALGRAWNARRPVPSPPQQVEQLLLANYVFTGSLFSRDACRSVGGFRSFTLGCEDWDLWLRMVAAGVTVHRPDLPTVLYRLHGDSLSANDAELDSELEVLESFKREHDNPHWHRVADLAIRRRRAKQQLRASYEAAATGQLIASRLHALRSFRGATRDGRIAAVAMSVAPVHALARRRGLRHNPARAVHR